MKYIVLLLLTIAHLTAYAQYKPKDYNAFDGKKQVIFSDDFDNRKPEWDLIPYEPDDTTRRCTVNTDSINYKEGKVYLFNNCLEPVYEEIKINVDYSRNFEIVTVALVFFDDTMSSVSYGRIYWNLNEDTKQHSQLEFTGYFNEIHTHLGFDSVKAKCIGERKVLKRSKYNHKKYVRYTVRKYNDSYYIFVNGVLKGTFPYQDTKGSYIGYSVLVKSKVSFDHLSISYLP